MKRSPGREENLHSSARLKAIALRQALGMTQSELARRSGVTTTCISRFEAGKQELRADVLYKLARQLGVLVDVLLDESLPGLPFLV